MSLFSITHTQRLSSNSTVFLHCYSWDKQVDWWREFTCRRKVSKTIRSACSHNDPLVGGVLCGVLLKTKTSEIWGECSHMGRAAAWQSTPLCQHAGIQVAPALVAVLYVLRGAFGREHNKPLSFPYICIHSEICRISVFSACYISVEQSCIATLLSSLKGPSLKQGEEPPHYLTETPSVFWPNVCLQYITVDCGRCISSHMTEVWGGSQLL